MIIFQMANHQFTSTRRSFFLNKQLLLLALCDGKSAFPHQPSGYDMCRMELVLAYVARLQGGDIAQVMQIRRKPSEGL